MNAYRTEASSRRLAFGAAAIALTALTMSLAVVVPANLEPAVSEAVALAKPSAHVTEVAIRPAVVDVVLYREHKSAPETTRSALTTRHPSRAARTVPAQTRVAPGAASTMVEWQCPTTADGRNV